jgi:hypothetical protein
VRYEFDRPTNIVLYKDDNVPALGTQLNFLFRNTPVDYTALTPTLRIGKGTVVITVTGTASGSATEATLSFTIPASLKASLPVGSYPYQVRIANATHASVIASGTVFIRPTL